MRIGAATGPTLRRRSRSEFFPSCEHGAATGADTIPSHDSRVWRFLRRTLVGRLSADFLPFPRN